MFEVGFTEIILILGIALVVLGPDKLPKVAAEVGRWVGRARAMARQFKSQLDDEVLKNERNWSRPEPAHTPPPKAAASDLDASPNRNAPPPPPAGPPPAAPAATEPAPGSPAGDADSP